MVFPLYVVRQYTPFNWKLICQSYVSRLAMLSSDGTSILLFSLNYMYMPFNSTHPLGKTHFENTVDAIGWHVTIIKSYLTVMWIILWHCNHRGQTISSLNVSWYSTHSSFSKQKSGLNGIFSSSWNAIFI